MSLMIELNLLDINASSGFENLVNFPEKRNDQVFLYWNFFSTFLFIKPFRGSLDP